MPAHFAATPRGGNILGLLAPDPRQEPTAPAPVIFPTPPRPSPCEGSLGPPSARGAGGRAPPTPFAEAWGRFSHVKGPRLRRCAAAGRTNPLTCLTLEQLSKELLSRLLAKRKAAQKGRR